MFATAADGDEPCHRQSVDEASLFRQPAVTTLPAAAHA
jgi:hypothetical protein